MHSITSPFAEGFRDAWVLAFVLTAAFSRGVYRVLRRLAADFVHHRPLHVRPEDPRRALIK
jgi:hypothetical protein